jgi:hypothetical protein
MTDFQEFPKIPRYKREVCITEKIDGTNAQVYISEVTAASSGMDLIAALAVKRVENFDGPPLLLQMLAGSRNRWLTRESDNFGFAKWVQENSDELFKLGPGRHFGEWWGAGIQRRYGLDEKRFSLFNHVRWADATDRPSCCHTVPLLGYFQPGAIDSILAKLRERGSFAAPGFMQPEGIVIWHSQSRNYYKVLLENDEVPKSLRETVFA